jgi:hypothetical protein
MGVDSTLSVGLQLCILSEQFLLLDRLLNKFLELAGTHLAWLIWFFN